MADLSGNANLQTAGKARVNAIIKKFTYALFLAALGALVGLLLKFMHLTGEQMVFTVAMSAVAFLLFLQTGISFVFVFTHFKLAFLGAFSSLSAGMACIAMLFLFQKWWGSQMLVLLTMPLMILSLIFLIIYLVKEECKRRSHRRFLYYNIVGSYLFLLVLWGIYLVHQQVSPNEREKRELKRQEEGIIQT